MNNTSNSSTGIMDPLRFCLFLIFDIFAIFCSTFTLYHLLKDAKLRKTIHNHATILILLYNLIYQLIDIPLHIQYFSTASVRPATPALCLIWWFIDYGFFFIPLVLVMWTSFERHIVIFHKWIFAKQRNRLFVHYIPLILIILFMMIFYVMAIFLPPCQNLFDYTADLCGMSGCYSSIPSFVMIERIGFSIVPTFLIAIINLALLVRVLWQKYRFHRILEWKKKQKLIIHIVSISFLYLCFDFPLSLISLVRLCGHPNWAHDVLPSFFYYSYIPVFLLPIVCIGSIPEIWGKVKNFILRDQ